jgi:hypothetical protein
MLGIVLHRNIGHAPKTSAGHVRTTVQWAHQMRRHALARPCHPDCSLHLCLQGCDHPAGTDLVC